MALYFSCTCRDLKNEFRAYSAKIYFYHYPALRQAKLALGWAKLRCQAFRPEEMSLREKHTPRFKKKRDLPRVFRGNQAPSSYLVVR